MSELLHASLATTRLPLAPATAVETAIDVAEALHYAHDRGVVHGHIHEANVLLSEAGAKVADFPLARLDDSAEKDGRPSFIRSDAPPDLTCARSGRSRRIRSSRRGTGQRAYDSAAQALTGSTRASSPIRASAAAAKPAGGWSWR